MELKIRYENEMQTIVLNDQETEQVWISLSLEDDGSSQEDREKFIQEAWEVQLNRPEYNCWHKFYRHLGSSKAKPGEGETEDDFDASEPLMSEVKDDRIFRRDEIERDERADYEAVCQWVRKVLVRKPKWADAFIAVRIDGMSVNDYAESICVSDASIVSKWLKRAEKKLRENYPMR